MNRHKRNVTICLVCIGFISLVPRLDNIDNWVVNMISHFPFQYALLSLVLMAICLWKKFTPLSMLSGFLFLINISALVGPWKPVQASEYARPVFTVYSVNINFHNDDLSKLRHELIKVNPDIIFLVEMKSEHIDQLHPIIKSYPYYIKKIDPHKMGFVFLSNFPVLHYNITRLSDYGNSLFEAILDINQQPAMFYGIHAQRPRIGNFNERKSQLYSVSRRIRKNSLPVILAGDLNLTPYSTVFRQMLKASDLRDSRIGFGWQPSWPTFFPFLWIPIDHILVSPGVQVQKRTTGSYIGSDHYPVIAELSIDH